LLSGTRGSSDSDGDPLRAGRWATFAIAQKLTLAQLWPPSWVMIIAVWLLGSPRIATPCDAVVKPR